MDDIEKAKRAMVIFIGVVIGGLSIFLFDIDISLKIMIPLFISLGVTFLLFVIFCDWRYEIRKFNENN